MIYAIGDIHGCYDQLLVLLAKIKSHAGAQPYRAVFLGDYVDRGPKSREVVNQVRGLVTGSGGFGKWTALRGNHEEIMATTLAGLDRHWWVSNGGGATIKSYEGYEADMERDAKWLNSLPTCLETENHFFVHAGCSPRYSLADQPDEVKLWIRNWEDEGHNFGKHVVYGHTPSSQPLLLNHSSGLDTGACYWGTLTCGVFDESKASGPIEILDAA